MNPNPGSQHGAYDKRRVWHLWLFRFSIEKCWNPDTTSRNLRKTSIRIRRLSAYTFRKSWSKQFSYCVSLFYNYYLYDKSQVTSSRVYMCICFINGKTKQSKPFSFWSNYVFWDKDQSGENSKLIRPTLLAIQSCKGRGWSWINGTVRTWWKNRVRLWSHTNQVGLVLTVAPFHSTSPQSDLAHSHPLSGLPPSSPKHGDHPFWEWCSHMNNLFFLYIPQSTEKVLSCDHIYCVYTVCIMFLYWADI